MRKIPLRSTHMRRVIPGRFDYSQISLGNTQKMLNSWEFTSGLSARLTADFGVTNAKLAPNYELREKSKTGIQSCLYTVIRLRFLSKFPDVYSLIYNFSASTHVSEFKLQEFSLRVSSSYHHRIIRGGGGGNSKPRLKGKLLRASLCRSLCPSYQRYISVMLRFPKPGFYNWVTLSGRLRYSIDPSTNCAMAWVIAPRKLPHDNNTNPSPDCPSQCEGGGGPGQILHNPPSRPPLNQ